MTMENQNGTNTLGDRVTASNLKSFIMDLAVIVAEFQRELRSHFACKLACHGAGHNPPMYNKRLNFHSKLLFLNIHKFKLF